MNDSSTLLAEGCNAFIVIVKNSSLIVNAVQPNHVTICDILSVTANLSSTCIPCLFSCILSSRFSTPFHLYSPYYTLLYSSCFFHPFSSSSIFSSLFFFYYFSSIYCPAHRVDAGLIALDKKLSDAKGDVAACAAISKQVTNFTAKLMTTLLNCTLHNSLI